MHNTQSSPGACQQAPVSTPNVLTYSLADLITWFNFLSEKNSESSLLTCCSLDFHHGMYDMGTPSATLYSREEVIGVAAVHQGISNSSVDAGECDLAEVYPGIILDDWLVN